MKKNLFLGFLIVLFCLGGIGIANAVIVNINSVTNHDGNPVSIFFNAGTYDVTPIGVDNGGAFNAWNAWSYVAGCDSNGENCSYGWLNRYYIYSSEFGEMLLTDHNRYANQSLALSNAISTSFTLTNDATVDFYIWDGDNGSESWDNSGGISLDIKMNCDFAVQHFETSTGYLALQDAYDDPLVVSSDTLLINTTELYENLIFDRNIVATFKGGYYCDFLTRDGVSIVNGSMVISNGTVIIDNIVII